MTTNYRPDKTRLFIIEPETTVGTVESFAAGAGVIIPALESSRLAPADLQPVSQNEALDGYAGQVADTAGASGMGVTLTCEIRDYSGALAFPPWVKLLLACGWEATNAGTILTLFPSTKPVTDWPGETAGARSPCSLSIGEVLKYNATTDEMVKTRGATGSAKIVLMTNGRVYVEATMKGMVAGSKFLDASVTNLSAYGTRAAGEAVGPIVVKGIASTVLYRDDSGDTAITPQNFRGLEIDMAAKIERVVDPEASEGYAPINPWHDDGYPTTLAFADTSDISPNLMAGWLSGRGFLSVDSDFTLGGARTLSVLVPRIQYQATRGGEGGLRMMSLSGKAVRSYAGDSTSPITIAWDYSV